MPYNPKIHHRRSIRLKGYDYASMGLYFITICCDDRKPRFGHIENGVMHVNEFGLIAQQEWEKLPERFSNLELDTFQIMPDHMHAIIRLNECGSSEDVVGDDAVRDDSVRDNSVGATLAVAHLRAGASPAPTTTTMTMTATTTTKTTKTPSNTITKAATVSDIIGAYKSLVANACLNICKSRNETLGKLWQRNYYEHIIRNGAAYCRIAHYIEKNPENWKKG